jgi:hypothetical protein
MNSLQYDFDDLQLVPGIEHLRLTGGRAEIEYDLDVDADWRITGLSFGWDCRTTPRLSIPYVDLPPSDPLYAIIADALDRQYGEDIERTIGDAIIDEVGPRRYAARRRHLEDV